MLRRSPDLSGLSVFLAQHNLKPRPMARASSSPVLSKIANALRLAGVRSGSRILVAVSGGTDSVALLHALMALRDDKFACDIVAAHINHGLRGAESDRDEAFVRDLCSKLSIPLKTERLSDLNDGASNLEERARDQRYAALE